MSIKVKALWLDPSLGSYGYICGLVVNGNIDEPVGMCGTEEWVFGKIDSLRRKWILPDEFIKEFNKMKPGIKQPVMVANLGAMVCNKIPGDAYRIWDTPHRIASVKSIDELDRSGSEFMVKYVPQHVKNMFPNAAWNLMD